MTWFTDLPIGTLLVDRLTGAAIRKVRDAKDRTDWRLHHEGQHGWGGSGSLTDEDYDDLASEIADGAVFIAWQPKAKADRA